MIGTTGALILGGLSAAGSIGGGLIGQGGANAAAAGSRAAAQQAYVAAQHQKDVNNSNYSPYTGLGIGAVNKIGQLLGFGTLRGDGTEGGTYNFDYADPRGTQQNALNDFYTSPGYGFRLQEGINALDRSAAAKGRLISGAQTKAVQNYGQGLASDEYNNWLNQYWKAAGMGQGATDSLTSANSGLTNSSGNQLVQGAANAGQYTAQGANALASGIGGGINNLITAGALGGLFGGGSSSYNSAWPVSNSPASAVGPRGGVWR